MSEYKSTSDLNEIARKLQAASSVAIISHARPDGDAAGSILALSRALRVMGKSVDAIFTGQVDPNIRGLAEVGEVRLDTAAPIDSGIDHLLVVDTGSWNQLAPLDVAVRAFGERVIGIDHHARGEEVAATRFVDTTAASTTQVLVRLIDELGIDLRQTAPGGCRTIAEALFVGLATDTGWFQFQNATPAVFALASRLLDTGVDRVGLYRALEENGRPERLVAMGRALASLELLRESRVAVMALSHADFKSTGATTDDAGGVVNIPLEIGCVRMSALLTESQPGITKISFRSKPRPDGRPWVNVSDFAAKFGGGGHVFAAGGRISAATEEARRRVNEAISLLEGIDQ